MMKMIGLSVLVLSTQLMAIENDEYKELINSSYENTSKYKVEKYTFQDNNILINIDFTKEVLFDDWNDGTYNYSGENKIIGQLNFNGNKIEYFNEKSVNTGQNVIPVICKNKSKYILTTLFYYGKSPYPRQPRWHITYIPLMHEISYKGIKKINKLKGGITVDDLNEERVVYPYYNKEKILERLYETNVCSRPLVKLSEIEKNLKERKELKSYTKDFFQNLLKEKPIEKKTLTTYNNIAYYLQKAGSNQEAIYLLEKILEKYPTLTVAHYNLADAYWA